MKKFFAGFLAVALVGCSPKDADDDSNPPAVAKAVAAAATPIPKTPDWMWKKPDGKEKKDNWSLNSPGALKSNKNPLQISDDPLNQKPKK
jgi:hypothetical protein